MKLLWLEQIHNTQEALGLPSDPSLLSKSVSELRRIATTPYSFEHALSTRRLACTNRKYVAMPFEDDVSSNIANNEPWEDVWNAELVPGGRWLVTLSRGDRHFNGLWLMIWDLEEIPEGASSLSPVAKQQINSGTEPTNLDLGVEPMPSGDRSGFMCFILSTVEPHK